ncbi:MAG: hypothetical protein ACLPTF_18505 [Steroidobacteraceae bacterium]
MAAQTVNDLTHALNKLHDRGINIAAEDLAHFSQRVEVLSGGYLSGDLQQLPERSASAGVDFP